MNLQIIFWIIGFVAAGLALGVAIIFIERLRLAAKRKKFIGLSLYPPAGKESTADVQRLMDLGHSDLAALCYSALHHVRIEQATVILRRCRPNVLGIVLVALVATATVISMAVVSGRLAFLILIAPVYALSLVTVWDGRSRSANRTERKEGD